MQMPLLPWRQIESEFISLTPEESGARGACAGIPAESPLDSGLQVERPSRLSGLHVESLCTGPAPL